MTCSKNYLSEIHTVQLEISNLCNALCLGCVRIDRSTYSHLRDSIPTDDMFVEPETVVKLLQSSALKNLVTVEFCGTIDEPLMHPRFLSILSSIYDFNPNLTISIHTNGSIRNAKYWEELASILKKFKRHVVKFSIDGKKETHTFYRQNTFYDRIMANAKTFIGSGGNAVWQFIEFEWNSHEVEDLKTLAKEMNFSSFFHRVDRSSLSLKTIVFVPNKKASNIVEPDHLKFTSKLGPAKGDIVCTTQNDRSIFVNFRGQVWPCCFISNGFLRKDRHEVDYLSKRMFSNYGENFNSLYHFTLDEILTTPLFASDLVDSWSSDVIDISPTSRISRCNETCVNYTGSPSAK